MSKYKVGDQVRVRTDLIAYTNNYLRNTSRRPICVDYNMLDFKGEILTIKEVVRDEYYRVKGTSWVWTDDMLESVTTTTNKYLDRPIQQPQSIQLPKKGQPMQQKEKKLKIFLKDGSINIKGIMYQLAKRTQITTHLPFVNKAIVDELARVKRVIRDITPKTINYNIKLAATLESFKEALKVKHVMTPTDAVMFYEYEKAHGSFGWIKKYLTPKNATSTTPVDLFKSNNRHIYICEGIIYLEEKDLVFATTIKFDKKTKQFFL